MVRGNEEGKRTCTYEPFKTSRFFNSFLPSLVRHINQLMYFGQPPHCANVIYA